LNQTSISIVIIHYKGQDLIIQAVESVIQLSGLDKEDLEFIIIDNSGDFLEETVNKLNCNYKLIKPGYNSGFARAVNIGIRASTKNHLCLMNQDACFIMPETLKKTLKYLEQLPEKTVVGCSLQDEHGNHQQSIWLDDPTLLREWKRGAINCKFNPKWQEKMELKKKEVHSKNGFVHRINGAFLVFKKPTKDKILFDEDFFLYGEDIEWANRIKRENWRFYHLSDIQVKHIGSASSSNEAVKLNQIEIMDWLSILKLRGKFYLVLYLKLKQFNKWLDRYLAISSKLNKQQIEMLHNDFTHFCLQKKYFLKIINNQSKDSYFDGFNLYKSSLSVVR
jgi:GT2 family glycosyltransferase